MLRNLSKALPSPTKSLVNKPPTKPSDVPASTLSHYTHACTTNWLVRPQRYHPRLAASGHLRHNKRKYQADQISRQQTVSANRKHPIHLDPTQQKARQPDLSLHSIKQHTKTQSLAHAHIAPNRRRSLQPARPPPAPTASLVSTTSHSLPPPPPVTNASCSNRHRELSAPRLPTCLISHWLYTPS